MASTEKTTSIKTSPTKRQRIGPKALLMDLLDDLILREIIAFLPDPETVCTFGGCCTRLNSLVKGKTAIWDRFLAQIPVRARPKRSKEYYLKAGTPEPTAKEIVLRFSSARLFAARMERLAPRHRVTLGEGNYCKGCKAFPNATGYDAVEDLYKDRCEDPFYFFVRYSVSGSLVWQGFLSSCFCNNGTIYLHLVDDDNNELDLSKEFDWPEMKAYLAYPPPKNYNGYPDCYDWKWRNEEKKRMARAMYKNLTLTIVVIKDDITDRHLGISTCGPDGTGKDLLGPDGYIRGCSDLYMEIMPFLSHGVSPKEPLAEEGYYFHPYLRTTEDKIHYTGKFIGAGHYYTNDRSVEQVNGDEGTVYFYNPEKYMGLIFGFFG